MTLLELYNLKLNEFKETGLKERPWKLLAMLLLSEKDKYEPIINSNIELYKEVNKKIAKIEKDFNLTNEDYDKFVGYIEDIDDIREQNILDIFNAGIYALKYGISHMKENTAEEIYSEYFDTDILKKNYDIEQKAKANNINITTLNNLINKIIDNQSEFYKKVCEEITEEERLFILKELENKSCMNCANQSCRVEYSEKVGTDELDNPKGSKCFGWFNSELIGRCKVLGKTDIKQLK